MAGRSGRSRHSTGTNTSQSSPLDGLDQRNREPVRIYPRNTAPSAVAAIKLLMTTTTTPVAVIGFLATRVHSTTGIYTFANRLIGRTVFLEEHAKESAFEVNSPWPATIQLFYDEARHVVYLVGISKLESDVLYFNANESMSANSVDMDLTNLMAKYHHEVTTMDLLLYTCCHLVFVFTDQSRHTTRMIQQIRDVSNEKKNLVSMMATLGAHKTAGKRDKSQSNSFPSSAFAPGRCIPLVLFVIPVDKDLFSSTTNTKSSIVAYCKTQENIISSMFRSLRRGIVGNLRTRDCLTASNVSKERRLFNIDPSHCVVVISNDDATEQGCASNRFDTMLMALPTHAALAKRELFHDQELFNRLKEDEMGLVHAVQSLDRFIDALFAVSASPNPPRERSGDKETKESSPVRMELLTLAQWLKSFKTIVKLLTKKPQDDTGIRKQLERIDLHS